jgi:DNA-binding protein Fis
MGARRQSASGLASTREAAGLAELSRLIAAAVPSLVRHLRAGGSSQLHRDAMRLLERPLLAHALVLTAGNQVQAARLLGLNRNTIRKRCRLLLRDPSSGEG